jgi:hypothetical protein
MGWGDEVSTARQILKHRRILPSFPENNPRLRLSHEGPRRLLWSSDEKYVYLATCLEA